MKRKDAGAAPPALAGHRQRLPGASCADGMAGCGMADWLRRLAGRRCCTQQRYVQFVIRRVYSQGMDVSVTDLRAHLSDWLDRARAGGEVVITDRGIPVARLTAMDSAGTLERLTAEGVIGKPTAQRPVAAGRSRPKPRRPVSDRVGDQRR